MQFPPAIQPSVPVLGQLGRFVASPRPQGHPVAYRLFHGAVPPTLSVRDQVAVAAAERIVLRRLAPGERIREQALVEEFNVSKAPVGEALLLLEQFGLVQCLAHRGVFVTRMGLDDFDELLEYRTALANWFVPRYVQAHTEADQQVLQGYLAQMAELLPEDERAFDFVELTDRCFLFLALRAGNTRIGQAMCTLSLPILRYGSLEAGNVRHRRRLLANWTEGAKILAARNGPQALEFLADSYRQRSAAVQAALQAAA
jgi:DNA-binding GntR family transcriptional regulator